MRNSTAGASGAATRTYDAADLRHAADRDLVARLKPGRQRPPSYTEADLYAAVPRRYSNRDPFWPDPVPADARIAVLEAARNESAWLDLLVGTTALTAISEIAYSADRVLRRDRHYQAELASTRP